MRLCGFGFSGTDRLFGGFRLISGRPTTLHPYIILLLYLTYKELKLDLEAFEREKDALFQLVVPYL